MSSQRRAALRALTGIGLATLGVHPVHAELAPALNLPRADGQAVPVFDRNARLSYVDFWASWCGPCRKSFPWMNQLQARFAAQGLRIIAVNLDNKREDADRFLAELAPQFTVLFDPQGSSARAYKVKGMPSSMLVDAKGQLLWRHAGFAASDAALLESRVESAIQTYG